MGIWCHYLVFSELLFWLGALGSGFSGARWERRLQWHQLPIEINDRETSAALGQGKKKAKLTGTPDVVRFKGTREFCLLQAQRMLLSRLPLRLLHVPCSVTHPCRNAKKFRKVYPSFMKIPWMISRTKRQGFLRSTKQKFAAAEAVVTSPPNRTGGAVFQHGGPSGRFLRRSLQQGAA